MPPVDDARSRSFLRGAIGLLAGLYALGAAIIAGFLFGLLILPTAVLPRGTREKYAIIPARWWALCVIRVVLLCRPRVTGTVDLTRGALLICNHRSWLDPLVLMAYGVSNGLSKSQIKYLPFIGLYGWLAGAVFFDRSNRSQRARARREVMMLVQRGCRIQLFPEGTRTRDGMLRDKVHLTLVRDCYEAGIPVIPCAVLATEAALPSNHFAAYFLTEPRLHFGRPIDPAGYADDKQFAQAAWQRVVEEVERLTAETLP